jgi:hypothetical protein
MNTPTPCPACQENYIASTGHYIAWDVMGDPRTTVEVCEICHRAAEHDEARA